MKANTIKKSLIVSVVTIFLLSVSSAAFAGMTLADVKSQWGEPSTVMTMDYGVKRMIFDTKVPYVGYPCVDVKDGQVIFSGAVESLSPQNASDEGAEVSTLNFGLSLDEVRALWGEPAAVVEMNDGVKRMVFGTNVPYVGYPYVDVKGGQIIFAGASNSIPQTKADTDTAIAASSKIHMTLSQVKALWGEPASVVKMGNGVERMVFDAKVPYVGYPCVDVKAGQIIFAGASDTLS